MAAAALTFLAALAALAQGAVHEKRSTIGNVQRSWRPTSRLSSDSMVPVRIALKQNNLDAGAEQLMSISHPESETYGKALSDDEVNGLFAPSDESVNAVRNWLLESGVPAATIAHSDSKGWLAVDLSVAHAERLFEAELWEFEHPKSGESGWH